MGNIRRNEEDESTDDPPGGIGSYLSRQEFGKRDTIQLNDPIESFSMSVDRGFLGKNPLGNDNFYRSMDDIRGKGNRDVDIIEIFKVNIIYIPTKLNF